MSETDAAERIETMRRMHAEILAEQHGSQERRVLEHKLGEFIRGRPIAEQPALEPVEEPFDPKKAAAGDEQ
ncbi:MAG TPA: hypothetical protein VK504_25030 [Vicinamibacterales bacterium]|nr:hypothetical protein [Vicinamibacterales bacterium]